jgi:hypothetical protein
VAEILVVFPRTGKPVVHNEHEAVMAGEPIYWHVHCRNKEVKNVELKFEEERAKFFPVKNSRNPNAPDQNHYGKPVKWSKRNGEDIGEVTIWGQAPGYSLARTDDKYKVVAIGVKGELTEIELDPTIITDGP